MLGKGNFILTVEGHPETAYAVALQNPNPTQRQTHKR
jgi:hypothetical protein